MTARLREGGPSQSDVLIHFCGRPSPWVNPSAPAAYRDLTPSEKLSSILWDRKFTGTVQVSGGRPVVCFAESNIAHTEWLLSDKGWAPWGMLFLRQDVYDAGGGPVWPAREQLINEIPEDLRHWAVRLDPTSDNPWGAPSDWLHEREWRLPTPPRSQLGKPIAVLIGSPTWEPEQRLVPEEEWVDEDGAPTYPGDSNAQPTMMGVPHLPPVWKHMPRMYWEPATKRLKPAPGPKLPELLLKR